MAPLALSLSRFILVLTIALIPFVGSAKILINCVPAKSHYLIMNAIAQELSSRGHEVVFPLPTGIGIGQNNPLVKFYDLPQEHSDIFKRKMLASNIFSGFNNLNEVMLKCCKAFLTSPLFKELQDVDIQVAELFTPCSAITAEYMGIPFVGVGSSVNIPYMAKWTPASYSDLSYSPYVFSKNPSKGLNFFQRAKNILTYIIGNFVLSTIILDPSGNRFMQDMEILPGRSYQDISSNAEIVLIKEDFILHDAQPLPPDVKLVGPLLIKPAETLPEELEEFMQSSGDNGVVLVCFGSTDAESSSVDVQQGLAAAFARLPYKVLWKTKDNSSLTLGKNTRTFSWIPQNDIMGHPKLKLFVTHAGNNGVYEALYHGVPMVSMPMFGDQPGNSKRLVSRQLSVEVDFQQSNEDIEEQMFNAITKVINDPGYKERLQHLSHVLRSRRRTPVQEAGDWIEHVLQVKDMSHLKPHGNKMYFYQRYLLDVLVFFILVLAVLCYILKVSVVLVVKCFKKICGKEQKSKSE